MRTEEQKKYRREWQRAKNATPEGKLAARKNNLRKKGLTPEQYDEMWTKQDGKCAGCKQPETSIHPRYGLMMLAVDHDHSCCPGEKSCGLCVRGLLCQRCNTALGWLQDDPDILRALIAYLGE